MVRGSEARPVPEGKGHFLGKVCSRALCKLECIHSLEFQLNSNQGSEMLNLVECDGQPLKRKPCSKLPPPGLGILTRPLKSSILPGRHLQCWQDPASANLLPASASPPYRVFLEGPSRVCAFPSPVAPPGVRIEQEAASSSGQSFLATLTSVLDYKRPTFPIQLVHLLLSAI